ncbi:hypothetical protein Taro_053041 [Colocasia esculenta]|uniref:Xrn1 helical domain-containing protein n=1 Tax=Colocasia esculenta TaxID=4460 RepID=A0A843XL12_COLES|nr:hypothetical protein [Colocasia esculenta]
MSKLGHIFFTNHERGNTCRFYPFHYAPFASDIKVLNCSSVKFTLGAPFKPFQLLMAVLPPRSAHALPKAFQQLMTDPLSGLKKFYPNGMGCLLCGAKK